MIRFGLFGIPVVVTWSFWIGSALLGSFVAHGANALLKLAVWIACAFLSILVHELGHALMARYYSVQPAIVLQWLGGVTMLPGRLFSRGQSILISLAGPLMGLALWLLAGAADRYLFRNSPLEVGSSVTGQVVYMAFGFLAFMNLYWTIFNLLPIIPLDGGQVLRELLGPSNLGITRIIGAVCAAAVCVWALLNGQPFIAIFLGSLAYSNLTGNTRNFSGGVEKG